MMMNFKGKHKNFNGAPIHKDATHAVAGRNFGTYFKIGDEWYFTVFAYTAMKCAVADQDFDIRNHIKDDAEITALK
ncbi:hypothetical protein [Enterobacter phage N5822]|nr:hypothetical protein [Enterobacter phage N5822]